MKNPDGSTTTPEQPDTESDTQPTTRTDRQHEAERKQQQDQGKPGEQTSIPESAPE